MSSSTEGNSLPTYLNPVYGKSFPDPYVLKFRGEYFAYCTGFAEDGQVFGVLRSSDLVNWSNAGGAMPPLDHSPPYYWAPEVFYDNGKFYLYYSVGNETFMELRVAVSERPDGGFADSGRRLTSEDFAIDAHVFVDDDGTKYLFYATDFLEHTHIGTGTVVDRMIDWFTLEGNPRPVTRARFDWQVYDPNRKEKGGVRWHTVEGPAVLKRKGLYYEMFSGGNWQNTSYGVSFAISDRVIKDTEWKQFSDGENVLPILRTIPDIVIGPGHNSIVRGPNNRELFCIYHRWTDAGRVMAIDRMDFAGDRIFLIGPSHSPQFLPFGTRSIKLESTSTFALPDAFVCEITFSSDQGSDAFGIELKGPSAVSALTLDPAGRSFAWRSGDKVESTPLPEDFDFAAPHLLRIEVDHREIAFRLDSLPPRKGLLHRSIPLEMGLIGSPNVQCVELCEGFEELFESEASLGERGWDSTGEASHRIEKGELAVNCEAEFVLRKGRPAASFEIAVNVRVVSASGLVGVRLEHNTEEAFRYDLDIATRQLMMGEDGFETIPDEVELGEYHQLRVVKIASTATCYFDDVAIGEFRVPADELTPAIVFDRVEASIEMIRWTVV